LRAQLALAPLLLPLPLLLPPPLRRRCASINACLRLIK
jgi:hypothetical protein